MMKQLGAAITASILMLGAAAAIEPTVAASIDMEPQAQRASEHHAHHHHRHRDRLAYRPEDQPRYYGRPVYYAPAPFIPLPPLFGYGWEPW
jgi:hypothetical protein